MLFKYIYKFKYLQLTELNYNIHGLVYNLNVFFTTHCIAILINTILLFNDININNRNCMVSY